MKAHYWIEFRGAKQVVLFICAIVLIAVFWGMLPDEITRMTSRRSYRRHNFVPVLMFMGWIGGWFTLLFVRAEDLHITAPFDYQLLCRGIALSMIFSSIVFAGIFVLPMFT